MLKLKYALATLATIPRAIIFTRNLMASLPCVENLVYDERMRASWSESTNLLHRPGSFDRELPSTYHESPYNLYVRLNSMQSSVQTAQEYREMRTQSINGLDREMQVLEAHMPEAEAIVGRMNAIHNKIGEKNIASSREIRKPRANK